MSLLELLAHHPKDDSIITAQADQRMQVLIAKGLVEVPDQQERKWQKLETQQVNFPRRHSLASPAEGFLGGIRSRRNSLGLTAEGALGSSGGNRSRKNSLGSEFRRATSKIQRSRDVPDEIDLAEPNTPISARADTCPELRPPSRSIVAAAVALGSTIPGALPLSARNDYQKTQFAEVPTVASLPRAQCAEVSPKVQTCPELPLPSSIVTTAALAAELMPLSARNSGMRSWELGETPDVSQARRSAQDFLAKRCHSKGNACLS
jgi:hypothetical protein